MAAGRKWAAEIGVEVADEAVLPPGFQDATSQLLSMKQKGVEYAYVQVTTANVAIVLRDAQKLGMKVKFGSNPYGFDENIVPLAGANAEGVTGLMPHVPYGTNVPGMKNLVAMHDKVRPTEKGNAMYVRGWTYVMVWSEALKRADKAGKLDGPGIKAASETLKDFSTGGLSQPVTYTPTDHRATMTSEIFQVQGGKLVKIDECTLPRTAEWLGL
jgi:branched-chain amino acid transport system substrate-binding protein